MLTFVDAKSSRDKQSEVNMLLCAKYVLPVTAEPIVDGAVLVRNGLIADIGSASMLKLRYAGEEVFDFDRAAIMPGFVNLHTHLENAALRDIVHDVPYASWVLKMREFSEKLDVSDWYDSAILGGLEMLSSGITTVADITSTGASCTAIQKLGLRGVIYREVSAMDVRRVNFAMRSAENDIMHWREEVDASRINVGISPAALYVCHPQVMQKSAQLAKKLSIPVALRLAGTREECDFVRYGSSPFSVDAMDTKRGFVEVPPWLPTGTTTINYALNWGAFEADDVLVVHGIYVDDRDVRKMREYGVSVATCPRINSQLGMGVAPITRYRRAGINVGLGTDSPAATNSTDMLVEMRVGMLVQRAVNSSSNFMSSATMLELATIGGARALKIDDKVGSLEVGKQADIIAVEMSSAHQSPSIDPVSTIIGGCNNTDVLMTMVAGNVLYKSEGWNVGVDVAHNIARVIEIRSKLRA